MKKGFKFLLAAFAIIAITGSLKLKAQDQGFGGGTCTLDAAGTCKCVRTNDENGFPTGYKCVTGTDENAKCVCIP